MYVITRVSVFDFSIKQRRNIIKIKKFYGKYIIVINYKNVISSTFKRKCT